MKSAQLGKRTSDVEVLSISAHGLWILVDDREHFLSFTHFPWFKHAAVDAVLNVQRPGVDHLYWPDLDVDLAVESIEHPARFPLVSRVRPNKRVQRTVSRVTSLAEKRKRRATRPRRSRAALGCRPGHLRH